MTFRLKFVTLVLGTLIIGGCGVDKAQFHEEEVDHAAMDHDMMENEHMSHDEVQALNNSTGENALIIPMMLKANQEENVTYTVRAQQGSTEIFDGIQTNTYGYNGSMLGPMLRLEKGETVKIKTINELEEDTTFHWHGLEVAGSRWWPT